MTTDTDFVRLNMAIGVANIRLSKLGLQWPPPERLYLGEHGEIREAQDGDDEAFVMVQTRCSELDDETAAHPNIARGAEYHYWRIMNGGESQ
jgi:hypothetical protein